MFTVTLMSISDAISSPLSTFAARHSDSIFIILFTLKMWVMIDNIPHEGAYIIMYALAYRPQHCFALVYAIKSTIWWKHQTKGNQRMQNKYKMCWYKHIPMCMCRHMCLKYICVYAKRKETGARGGVHQTSFSNRVIVWQTPRLVKSHSLWTTNTLTKGYMSTTSMFA